MLAALAGFFSALLESAVVRFIAFKVVLVSVFLFVLPVVLNNFMYYMAEQMLSRMSSVSVSPVVVHLTGFSAFLAQSLKIPEGISILLSAVSLRFTLSLIKRVF